MVLVVSSHIHTLVVLPVVPCSLIANVVTVSPCCCPLRLRFGTAPLANMGNKKIMVLCPGYHPTTSTSWLLGNTSGTPKLSLESCDGLSLNVHSAGNMGIAEDVQCVTVHSGDMTE